MPDLFKEILPSILQTKKSVFRDELDFKEYKPFIVLAIGKIGDYQKIDRELLERELQKRERKISISKKL